MQESLFSNEQNGPQWYMALARRYRPKTFSDMVGQHVLAQTISNAIAANRAPHAIILTGIRGVGKTTSARIIARALNCTGLPEGGSDPCGICEHCIDINEDRHQDIIEIDAASNTGVNDIRELIDNARYKPLSARYKVYIIDEVHMLSNSAFNALLKILEEPPLHVIFILATTEIKKIPATILSRCQRFDLKRVDVEDLLRHYSAILEKEGFRAEQGALLLIARAAQGSVRDGLSMLDQALSLTSGNITEESIRKMLGLADVGRVFALFDDMVTGDTKLMLETLKSLYNDGMDPCLLLQELLEILHAITTTKASGVDKILDVTEFEHAKYTYYASKLSIPFLSMCWQVLLKGLEEMKGPIPQLMNLEMVLIRVAHMTHFPISNELVGGGSTMPAKQEGAALLCEIKNPEDIADLCVQKKDVLIYHHLVSDVKFLSLSANEVQIRLLENAPKNFHLMLQDFLREHTGVKWIVRSVQAECSSPTIMESELEKESVARQKVANDDLVQGILNTFTDTEILDIKTAKYS